MSPENTKNIKILSSWGTPLLELTQLPRPGSRFSTKPHSRSQHSGLPASALGPKQPRAPKLLLNHGPSEPCYTTEHDYYSHV